MSRFPSSISTVWSIFFCLACCSSCCCSAAANSSRKSSSICLIASSASSSPRFSEASFVFSALLSSSRKESINALFFASTFATSFFPPTSRSCTNRTARAPPAGSYSQKPNVDTRFQLITDPHVARICLIMGSGTFSLMLPTNTVTIGPS
uniref:Putative secreted protein n=1 Tax=Anopheles darlingi TaxID=43151 RepID=A0A2M4D100_ANODA